MLDFKIIAFNSKFSTIQFSYNNGKDSTQVGLFDLRFGSEIQVGRTVTRFIIELNEYKLYDTLFFKNLVDPIQYYKGITIKETENVSYNDTE